MFLTALPFKPTKTSSLKPATSQSPNVYFGDAIAMSTHADNRNIVTQNLSNSVRDKRITYLGSKTEQSNRNTILVHEFNTNMGKVRFTIGSMPGKDPSILLYRLSGQSDIKHHSGSRMKWSLTFYDTPAPDESRSEFIENSLNPYFNQPDYLVWPRIASDREGLQTIMGYFVSLLPKDKLPEQLREPEKQNFWHFMRCLFCWNGKNPQIKANTDSRL